MTAIIARQARPISQPALPIIFSASRRRPPGAWTEVVPPPFHPLLAGFVSLSGQAEPCAGTLIKIARAGTDIVHVVEADYLAMPSSPVPCAGRLASA